jgi:hypothetical protein
MSKPFKCKLKDLVHDLEQLGVVTITMEKAGVGLAIAQELKSKGIRVELY